MSSKKQTHANKKASSKQWSPKPTIEQRHITAQQQTYPATIIQRACLDSRSLTPGDVLQLQRTIGNQGAGQLLAVMSQRRTVNNGKAQKPRPSVQKYSHMSANDSGLASEVKPTAGESVENCQAVERVSQLEVGSVEKQVGAKSASGGGTGMPDRVRAKMENAFDTDFSSIKIHADSQTAQELGALAYTQGNDIHFAPGRFNLNTTKGQELLGHELAHVVQQRQGKVRATRQAAGMPINDDLSLEQEADVMGKKAARGEAVPLTSESPNAPGIIQRAVGFEFETGWRVWEETGKKSGKFKPLPKKARVGTYNGFNIEADEAGGGESELEFIVDPPITAVESESDSLSFVMDYMTIYGRGLLQVGKEKELFRLMEVTGRRRDEKFLIKKVDNELKAGPQVTAGVSLDKLSEIGAAQEGATLPAGFTRSVNTIKSIKATIKEANLDDLAPGPLSPQLKGLLSIITSYLWAGENKGLEYPKQIADVFLLARTDFAQLFRMLPANEKKFYKKNPRTFVALALRVSGHEGRGDQPVIEHGVRLNPHAPYTPIGPTRDKWLFFITEGYDLLSAEIDKEFESMGEFGSKTEPVGPQSKEAGIFEFRGAQTTKIPLEQWAPFAMSVFSYLINLEKENTNLEKEN